MTSLGKSFWGMVAGLLFAGPSFAGGDADLVTLNIDSNKFCGYWRPVPEATHTQHELPGLVPASCTSTQLGDDWFLFGDCSGYQLESGDYRFQHKAAHNAFSVIRLSTTAPTEIINMPLGGNDLELTTSPAGDVTVKLRYETVGVERNGFGGDIGIEYVNAPITGCARDASGNKIAPPLHIPRGSEMLMVVAGHAGKWLHATPWGVINARATSEISSVGKAAISLNTYDVAVVPDFGSNQIEWKIYKVTDYVSGVQNVRLPAVGRFRLEAKGTNAQGKPVSGWSMVRFTDGCRLSHNLIAFPGIGHMHLAAVCTSLQPKP